MPTARLTPPVGAPCHGVGMETWTALTLGLLGGIGAGVLIARGLFAVRVGSLSAERDLLRERVVDLEATVADDAQTAAVLRPLADALGRVERQVGTLERDRVEQFTTIRSAMARVEEETGRLGRETSSLAGSLNSSSVRGAWGEVQLRRVLELAGLLHRCDFDEQVRSVSRQGRQVRPDVIVALPGEKSLVVDAKAPMTAFLQAQGEDVEPSDRTRLLAEHATALSAHVRSLAAKEYWSALATTPEMVVCFVPSEAMLSSALAADPSLHEVALARRVVLVGPGSLLALLRTVAYTWQQESLTEHARELLELGRELHARLSTLGGHVSRLGGSLQRSIESYNSLVGALESRVLVTARRMEELDLVEGDLTAPAVVEMTPRVLTAMELIERVAEEDARPELDVTETSTGDGVDSRSGNSA
jgi:DNA recombination protein RmuC